MSCRLAYLFRLVKRECMARRPEDETKIKENLKVLVPIFILVGAIFILGLFPSLVLNPPTHLTLPI